MTLKRKTTNNFVIVNLIWDTKGVQPDSLFTYNLKEQPMSNALLKFNYKVDAEGLVQFLYTDSNGKRVIFTLKDMLSDPNDPESLIVDYDYSLREDGLDTDEFNKDFTIFVTNIIEESLAQKEESKIDTKTKLSDLI